MRFVLILKGGMLMNEIAMKIGCSLIEAICSVILATCAIIQCKRRKRKH